MKLIEGTKIAKKIDDEIKETLSMAKGRRPGLAFVLVGDDPASRTYIKMKKKRCNEVGIFSFDREFPKTISEQQLLKEIHLLNENPAVDGILVQLPLPPHISTQIVMETVSPAKDVDGFHPLNVGKMFLGETDGFFPCTPKGILVLLSSMHIPVSGKHVVIVGRSNIVGKPLAALLMQKSAMGNATVTVANSLTEHLSDLCKTADILVAAMGSPLFINKHMVKKGAVVIDVGINRLPDGRIVGDVDFDEVASLCSYITPVPGGVGPMTIAMLLSNTMQAFYGSSLPHRD